MSRSIHIEIHYKFLDPDRSVIYSSHSGTLGFFAIQHALKSWVDIQPLRPPRELPWTTNEVYIIRLKREEKEERDVWNHISEDIYLSAGIITDMLKNLHNYDIMPLRPGMLEAPWNQPTL